NDNTAAQGGIDTTACTPQSLTEESGTISSNRSSPTITGTSTSFTGYSVGGTIVAYGNPSGGGTSVLGFISSVNSATSITLTSNASQTFSGNFYYSPPWSANCGFIWYFKHMEVAPLLTPTQNDYYDAGGAPNAGPQNNLTYPVVMSFIALGFALAQDDSRAQTLLTQSYNYFLTQEQNFGLSSYSGFPEEGAGYPHEMQAAATVQILAMLQNAVVSPPAIGGTMAKRWAQEFYLVPFPYSPINQFAYGTSYNSRYYQFSQGPGRFGPMASYLLNG